MTDAAGALTWDAQFRPFGETHAITGPADNDQRFPGQLFDPETGAIGGVAHEIDCACDLADNRSSTPRTAS